MARNQDVMKLESALAWIGEPKRLSQASLSLKREKALNAIEKAEPQRLVRVIVCNEGSKYIFVI